MPVLFEYFGEVCGNPHPKIKCLLKKKKIFFKTIGFFDKLRQMLGAKTLCAKLFHLNLKRMLKGYQACLYLVTFSPILKSLGVNALRTAFETQIRIPNKTG